MRVIIGVFISFIFFGCTNSINTSFNSVAGLTSDLTFNLLDANSHTNSPNGGKKEKINKVLEEFITTLSIGNCDNALKLSTGRATELVEAIKDAGCVGYKSEIISINSEVSDSTAICSSVEDRDGGRVEYKYELIFENKKWKVEYFQKNLDQDLLVSSSDEKTYKKAEVTSRVGGETKQEKLILKFVTSLAKGDCDKALKLSTGRAKETVQATIESGCRAYNAEIIAVECVEKGALIECECKEIRDGMEMTFIYSLAKEKGKWKVEYYEKDMSDFNLGEEEDSVPKE